jgi:hypothetical protein
LRKLRNEELLYTNYYFDQNNEDKTYATRSTDEEMRNGQKLLIGKGNEITDLRVLGTDGSKIYEYILQQNNMCVCVCLHLIREAQENIFLYFVEFYISLTVHLGIILVNNQHDALFQCIYLFNFSTCFEQPSAHHQENQIVSIHHLVYITLCR